MNAPCKNCSDRHYKCHSECEKYIAYNSEREKIRAKKKANVQNNDFVFSTIEHLQRKKRSIEYNNRGKKR